MKKLFTLTALLLLMAVSANAQDRKTWDFRKGFSASTIANLQADTKNWTDSEGSGRNWAESKARTANTEITCEVNGETWVVPVLIWTMDVMNQEQILLIYLLL